jgi:hypothetical protein
MGSSIINGRQQSLDHAKKHQTKPRTNSNGVALGNKDNPVINTISCSDFITDQELDIMTTELDLSGRFYPETTKAMNLRVQNFSSVYII